MFYHIDLPAHRETPDSVCQQKLHRERAKQNEQEAKILAATEQLIDRFAQGDTKRILLNPADRDYYIRRSILYQQLTSRLDELDPVRDYSEINGINHKRLCIRQDFRQLYEKTKYKL